MYQSSYYQIWIKVAICQTDSSMTLCELCQSRFSNLSGSVITKWTKICFLSTYIDKMITQQIFNVLCQLEIYNIFTNAVSIFWKVFTEILKISELPKIYNKIILPNICIKNSPLPDQFCVPVASGFWTIALLTLLKLFPRAQRALLALNLKKNARKDFSSKMQCQENSFLLIWCCPYSLH